MMHSRSTEIRRSNLAVQILNFLLLSATVSATAQTDDPKFASFVNFLSRTMTDYQQEIVSTDEVDTFQATDTRNEFKQIDSTKNVQVIFSRKKSRKAMPVTEFDWSKFQDDQSYSRLKLLHFDDKIYIKIEIKSRFDESEPALYVEHSGVYEANAREGSWEGYENGGPLVLALTKGDHERRYQEIGAVLEQPEVKARLASTFVSSLRAQNEEEKKKATEKGMPQEMIEYNYNGLNYIYANGKVSVTASCEGSPVIYRVEGDKIEATCEGYSSTFQFGFIVTELPTANGANPEWFEQISRGMKHGELGNEWDVKEVPKFLEREP